MARMVNTDSILYSLENIRLSGLGKRKSLDYLKALLINNSMEVPDQLKKKQMSDLISREDAINEAYYIAIGGEIFEVVQVETLLGLPSAERTGEWIWVQYDSNPELGNFHCSECNFIPACFNLARKHLNYCPNCGCRMKGEEE